MQLECRQGTQVLPATLTCVRLIEKQLCEEAGTMRNPSFGRDSSEGIQILDDRGGEGSGICDLTTLEPAAVFVPMVGQWVLPEAALRFDCA